MAKFYTPPSLKLRLIMWGRKSLSLARAHRVYQALHLVLNSADASHTAHDICTDHVDHGIGM